MKKPKSKILQQSKVPKLPLYEKRLGDIWNEKHQVGESLNQYSKYIIKACNNFPKVIELLRRCEYFMSDEGYSNLPDEIDKFLKSLEL